MRKVSGVILAGAVFIGGLGAALAQESEDKSEGMMGGMHGNMMGMMGQMHSMMEKCNAMMDKMHDKDGKAGEENA
jgi:hypothetical protein